MNAEFDYIIAGGGTSGCAVAGRLAEDPNARILLVEAGDHNRDVESVHMAGDYAKMFTGPHSWNFESAPQKQCNNRKIPLHRGRFLGGSSGVNTTFAIRGTKLDYDDWGLPGWSGEEFFAAMRKAETFHPKDWFAHEPNAHGMSGPVHLEPHDLAPISELMLDSFKSYGLSQHDDMFSTGEHPKGCGHAVRTINQGRRSTGADYVTGGYAKSNVEIRTHALANKIILERTGNSLRAVGIELVAPDGARSTVRSRREIIISGGAYSTPAILMRSGIGPKAELQRIGIECHLDSPGVGQNLHDHVICFVPYEVARAGLTTDHLAWHGDAYEQNLAQYRKDRTGFLGIMPFGVFAFSRLDDRLKDSFLWQEACKRAAPGRDPMGLSQAQPNMEIFHTECATGGAVEPTGGEEFIMFTIVELFSARSTGTVTIASADPEAKPIIDHNYFADPLDLEVFSEGCHLANEIVMKGSGTGPVMKGSWPPDGKHHAFKNREDWKPWIRDNCQTCYHPTGTCRMGKDGDIMAVLDPKLRVRGVPGLRVADCSVMPKIPNGHTQMPAYGIGERCADFIKEDAKRRSVKL